MSHASSVLPALRSFAASQARLQLVLKVASMGPLFRALVRSMGEARAFAHVERILQIHAHSTCCMRGESAALPSRRAEKELLKRLRAQADEYGLDVNIRDTSRAPQSGDIIVMGSVLSVWDSKHYSKPVPWTQVRKLARDVRVRGGAFGVMVAPKGVVRIRNQGICDGVPIHVCKPHMELACLYLSSITDKKETEQTRSRAKEAHLRAELSSLVEKATNLLASV